MQIQNAILTGSTTVYGPITFVSGTLAGSASYAATSSYADTFTVAGSLTAQTLVVQTITSSVSFITGSTRFGSLLTNTHEFTGSLRVTGSAISLSNSKVIIGDDGTYGGNISTVGFGGTSNGFNRIAAANNTSDGLYLIAATGRGIYLRPGGKSTQDLSVFPNGNTALGVNFLLPTATLHISGSGSGSLMQISSTVSSSIFFVSGSGNVGIGTSSPGYTLDVRTDTGVLIKGATSNSDAILSFLPTTGGRQYDFRNFGSSFAILDSSANITRMYFNFSGNTGIGLTNPSALLHISGSGSGSLMQISSHVSSNIFFVSGSGNIGIGTTTPTEKLDVIGGAVAAGNGTIRTGITYSTLGLIGTFTNHDLGVITNGTEKMRISSDGSMGFGRNALASRSFVFQGLTSRPLVIEAVESANTHSIMMRPNNSGYNLISSNYLVGSTYLPLSLSGRENTSDFVLATNGNVGIGTNSPSGASGLALAINGGASQTRIALKNSFTGDSSGDGFQILLDAGGATVTLEQREDAALQFSTNSTTRMTITNSGSLTIGTSEVVGSNSKLIVSSSDAGPSFINQTQGQQNLLCWNKATSGDNLWIEFHAGSTLGVKGSIDYNRASNLTRFNTSSDINLKNIIGDSNKEKSIGILSSTKIREYSWKDDTTNKSQIGVIAQELYQTFKGAVSVGSDESLLGTDGYKPWAVDKTAFTFHLIAGWQEHERIIQELSTKLEEATTRIKTLESK